MKYYNVVVSKKKLDEAMEKYKGHVLDWDFNEDGKIRLMLDINPKEVKVNAVATNGDN